MRLIQKFEAFNVPMSENPDRQWKLLFYPNNGNTMITTNDGRVVVEVEQSNYAEADTKLILAAPQMLELLKRVYHENTRTDNETSVIRLIGTFLNGTGL